MSMSTSTIRTRGNIPESNKKIQYDIRTEDVKKYLEAKFRFINNALTAKGVPNVELINVSVRNLRIGKQFLPFIVLLPEAVLDRANYDPNTPAVFRPEDDDDAVRLKPYYYHFLSNYMYTKEEINFFNSSSWRRSAGVTNTKNLHILRKYSKPAIETVNAQNGKLVSVFVLLDPLKIFHEMLIDEGNQNQRFSVYIDSMQCVEDNCYTFSVSREVNKRSKEDTQQFNALIKAMQLEIGKR